MRVGLAEDWDYTSDEVWNAEEGYIPREEVNVYASGYWTTPAMEVVYKDGKEELYVCWINGDDADSYFE